VTFWTDGQGFHLETRNRGSADGNSDLYFSGTTTFPTTAAWRDKWGADLSPRASDDLVVSTDGVWAVTFSPMSYAPPLPQSGERTGAFLYDGPATTMWVTHDGQHDFEIHQTSNGYYPQEDIYVTGEFAGRVPLEPGPSLVAVRSLDRWQMLR
jgi:hypothetical protein